MAVVTGSAGETGSRARVSTPRAGGARERLPGETVTSPAQWLAQIPEVLFLGPPSALPRDIRGPVFFDTETSGLHPDDGARVSCVSAAWIEWGQDGPVAIVGAAWPFAQGKHGKIEDDGKRSLFGEDDDGPDGVGPNLQLVEWQALLAWLEAAGVGLVGHNIKFDVTMMRAGVRGLRAGTDGAGWAGLDLVERVVWDTQVAAKELDPLAKTALKGPGSVSDRYWGGTDDEKRALKPWLGPKTDPRYDLVPWDVMEVYSRDDAFKTARAWLMQQWRVAQGEVAQGGSNSGWGWIRRETELLRVLSRMERRGLPYDADASRRVARRVAREQDKAEAQFGMPMAAARDFYFGVSPEGGPVRIPTLDGGTRPSLGLEPYSVTAAKREPQFTVEVVDQLVEDGAEGAELVKRFRALDVANRMWYLPYAQGTAADGRLRTVFRQVASGFEGEGGTRSGRYSVERLNLQAIPHDYRLEAVGIGKGAMRSPRGLIALAASKLEGWDLWELDLAQAELRVAAMWAECERMLAAIRDGRDLHGDTCSALFGIAMGAAGWDKYRQVSKRGNFSLIFGSGWLTFQGMVRKETGIRLADHEAAEIVTDWNRLYPEFGRAIDAHARRIEWGQRGAIGMPLANGRVRWWRPFEDTHKAFNQRVQASLAELGKDWMIAADEIGREADLDGRGERDEVGAGGLLITIHDSQVWMLPSGHEGQELIERIKAAGLEVWTRLFPGVPGQIDVKRWK